MYFASHCRRKITKFISAINDTYVRYALYTFYWYSDIKGNEIERQLLDDCYSKL